MKRSQALLSLLCAAAAVAAPPEPLAPGAFAQTPAPGARLTVGPGVLTFPEIADKLSVGGRVVRVSTDLEQKAGFVYLKGRTWAETQTFLKDGLAVAFVPAGDSPNAFVMVRDPETLKQDRLFQIRLLDNFRAQHRTLTAFLEANRDRTEADLRAETNTLTKSLQNPDGSLRSDLSAKEAREINERLNLLARVARWKSNPTDLFAISLADNDLSRLTPAFFETGRFHTLYAADDLNPTLRAGLQEANRSNPARAWTTTGTDFRLVFTPTFVQFAPLPFALTTWGANTSLDVLLGAQVPDPLWMLFEAKQGGTTSGFFAALGPEATAYREAEQKHTEAFLKAEGDTKFRVKPGVVELSQAVEAWSAKYGREAVMELAPVWEALVVSQNPIEEARFAGRDREVTWRQCLIGPESNPTEPRFGMEQRGGVLLVRSKHGFLNRPRRYPLGLFLAWERARTGRNDAAVDADPAQTRPGSAFRLAEFEAVVSARWPRRPADYVFGGAGYRMPTYRGGGIREFDRALPILFLWRSLPDWQREKALDALRDTARGRYTRVFIGFPKEAVATVLEYQQASGYLAAFTPTYAEALSAGGMNLRQTPPSKPGGYVGVSIGLEVEGGEWRASGAHFPCDGSLSLLVPPTPAIAE
jgi:hypothetical protein